MRASWSGKPASFGQPTRTGSSRYRAQAPLPFSNVVVTQSLRTFNNKCGSQRFAGQVLAFLVFWPYNCTVAHGPIAGRRSRSRRVLITRDQRIKIANKKWALIPEWPSGQCEVVKAVHKRFAALDGQCSALCGRRRGNSQIMLAACGYARIVPQISQVTLGGSRIWLPAGGSIPCSPQRARTCCGTCPHNKHHA